MNADKMIWGLLIHLGRNLWKEGNPEGCADHVRCDEKVWNDVTEHLAECGGNMIVIDCAEAVEYPSHPELAVKGTWSVGKMRKELDRLRAMGLEPIPKLNFSACHDGWLKEYGHMLSTSEYYKVVSDVIRDTAELFGHPRFFHLGWDEECDKLQKDYDMIVIRQGRLWWHDMLFTANEVRKYGCRPWIWSDKEWLEKDDFMVNCPRDIVQSHWYYSPYFGEEALLVRDEAKMRAAWERNDLGNFNLHVVKELEDAGFDQIPCGSNIYHDNSFPDFVRHCLNTVAPERLLGFLIAPWNEVRKGKWDFDRGKYLVACEQLAGGRGIVANRNAPWKRSDGR